MPETCKNSHKPNLVRAIPEGCLVDKQVVKRHNVPQRLQLHLERESLVGLAWAISEKIPTQLYSISGSLLDLRYKNKNKFKSSCKTAQLVAAATFSVKTAKEHILSLGKYDLYDSVTLRKRRTCQNLRYETALQIKCGFKKRTWQLFFLLDLP